MPTNTAMSMFLTGYETEMHIMEIWLRINCFDFTYMKMTSSDVGIVKIIFYCSRYFPSRNYCQAKNITIALAITVLKGGTGPYFPKIVYIFCDQS